MAWADFMRLCSCMLAGEGDGCPKEQALVAAQPQLCTSLARMAAGGCLRASAARALKLPLMTDLLLGTLYALAKITPLCVQPGCATSCASQPALLLPAKCGTAAPAVQPHFAAA